MADDILKILKDNAPLVGLGGGAVTAFLLDRHLRKKKQQQGYQDPGANWLLPIGGAMLGYGAGSLLGGTSSNNIFMPKNPQANTWPSGDKKQAEETLTRLDAVIQSDLDDATGKPRIQNKSLDDTVGQFTSNAKLLLKPENQADAALARIPYDTTGTLNRKEMIENQFTDKKDITKNRSLIHEMGTKGAELFAHRNDNPKAYAEYMTWLSPYIRKDGSPDTLGAVSIGTDNLVKRVLALQAKRKVVK